jgi:hypothetical protein
MQISAKQRLLRVAAGSIFAAGTVLIPAAVASAEIDGVRKGPPQLPPNVPTDPIEGLPVPLPGGDG